MKYLALINENSGTVMKIGPEKVAEAIERQIGAVGGEVEIVRGGGGDLIDAAGQHADRVDAVICAGGDGTQAGVAGALRGRKAALLPLPCGTINILCRDLGIPLEIEEALATGLAAPVQRIDIGLAGDRAFLNNVVFGSYAELAEAREEIREMETIGDLGDAIAMAATAIVNAQPVRFDLELDGARSSVTTNTVVISLGRITDSENLVPHRERLANGDLIVYLTESKNGVDLAGIILNFLKGEVEDAAHIEGAPCDRCRVDGRGADLAYTIDGDPLQTSAPVELTIVRKSVKVFYPALAADRAPARAAQ